MQGDRTMLDEEWLHIRNWDGRWKDQGRNVFKTESRKVLDRWKYGS